MNAIMNLEYKHLNNYMLKNAISMLEYPEIFKDESIGERFMEILDKDEIYTVFQPIISLKDGFILGFEALSRGPKNSALENPGMLFDVARVYGKLWELEFQCRIKALESASKNDNDFTIFINPSFTGGTILELFNNNQSILGLPVVDQGRLLGLIMKDKFYAKLGTQYGYALFLNRPVTLMMDKRPLSIDYETTIDIASKLAMTRNYESLYDYIIVTKGGSYYGIVTVKDLLEKTIDLEVNYAKHLNPLSGLPGNMLIEQKLRDLVSNTSSFTVLYIDIDNFKAYNDVYGFENGDRMLQFLGKVITDSVSAECYYNNFIGHVGGDDFVIAIESYDVENICNNIISSFEKGVTEFYTSEHLKSKSIFARNRHGKEEQYGLVTLSIAGVSNRNRVYNDIYELTEDAGRLKKQCKEQWYNSCIIE